MSYILAFDSGTTSVRTILFNHDGAIVAVAQKEIRQIFPQPGWVEHDPEEIWSSQLASAIEVLARARVRPKEVVGLGITNQRETTIIWDRETGRPIHNAIVWQDRRTAAMCDQLRAAGHDRLIQKRTGLVLDAYFSGTKIAWLLDQVPGARQQAEQGQLLFGTVDTWLIWKLTTDKRIHVTDPTNASRTLLYNLHTGAWDPELARLLRVPMAMLPEIRSSSEVYGEVSTTLGLSGVPIAGAAGDQQAALFGQLCVKPGLAKCTYGTGCFMLEHIGTKPVPSKQRLLTTVALQLGKNPREFALEGSVFIGGAVVQWLRDGLQLVRSASEVDLLAASVPDSGGVFLVPAFAGLGAPHWDSYARGTLMGITRDTNAAHISRAALEGIAFQVADLLDAMQADTGKRLTELRVDGGACRSEPLMQFQADILGVPVVRPKITETTALGAAYLAGLAVGFWKNLSALSHQWQVDRTFEPKMARPKVAELRQRWNDALSRSKSWLPPEASPARKRRRR